ncbi:MAG: hypothetical protein ACE5FS_13845 [Paracoccaceae bacterium]
MVDVNAAGDEAAARKPAPEVFRLVSPRPFTRDQAFPEADAAVPEPWEIASISRFHAILQDAMRPETVRPA